MPFNLSANLTAKASRQAAGSRLRDDHCPSKGDALLQGGSKTGQKLLRPQHTDALESHLDQSFLGKRVQQLVDCLSGDADDRCELGLRVRQIDRRIDLNLGTFQQREQSELTAQAGLGLEAACMRERCQEGRSAREPARGEVAVVLRPLPANRVTGLELALFSIRSGTSARKPGSLTWAARKSPASMTPA